MPLLCFDASLWNTPVTDYLFQGMIRVCNDFFDTMKEQIDEDMMRKSSHSNSKKSRNQSTTSNHDGETTDPSKQHDEDDIETNQMEEDSDTTHHKYVIDVAHESDSDE
jgi:hypothetical protein